MASNLSDPTATESAAPEPGAGDPPYSVSAAPVIPARNGAGRQNSEGDDFYLPSSYGQDTLWLLPRDPRSLFAYWDIDWKTAFGEENPKPRKVQLRVLNTDGSGHTSLEVEPMAGHCSVTVTDSDAEYRAEIGYSNEAGEFQVVSRSQAVAIPPAVAGADAPVDFSTLPLHLSFQRLLDATRSVQEKDHSLTETLNDLRQRAAQVSATFTAQQREVIQAVEEAAARAPAPAPSAAAGKPDLWAEHSLERIFGFGNSSLSDGFGGSSGGR